MPDFRSEIDAEALAVAWLKTRTAVTDLVASTAIGTRLRRDWTDDDVALRIRRVGGVPTESRTQHLGRYVLQVEAFAPSSVDAFALAAAAELELRRVPSGTHAGAVVTDVRRELGLTNSPDPDSDAERYLFRTVLYAHAAEV